MKLSRVKRCLTLQRMAELPLALHVRGDVPFNVAHSDLRPLGSRQEGLFKGETICVHKADVFTSSRHHVHEALRHAHSELHFAQHIVRVSAAPLGTLPITYVGHSPLRQVTVHDSYVYVDQRVCAPTQRSEPHPPTVLDHGRFASWLRAVATAHGGGWPARPAIRSAPWPAALPPAADCGVTA